MLLQKIPLKLKNEKVTVIEKKNINPTNWTNRVAVVKRKLVNNNIISVKVNKTGKNAPFRKKNLIEKINYYIVDTINSWMVNFSFG